MRATAAILIIMATPASLAAGLCAQNDASSALACYDQLSRCVSTRDPAQRLACYRAGGPDQLVAAESALVKPAPTAPAAIEEAFPVAGAASEKAEESPVLSAKVIKTERNAHKYYYLWLDNGHVWREKEKSRFRYKEGDAVTISKGALGSNQLKLVGKTGMVRVERVK